MFFDGILQGSMAPEANCRQQNAFSEFNGAEVVLDGVDLKKSKNFCRKKMELRRIKSVPIGKSGDLVFLTDRYGSTKKNRSNVKKEIKLIKEALLVQLPTKNDVVGGSRDATCLTHGAASIIGRRREMEDAVAAELGFLKKGGKSYNFFGVYDGHGGWRVARSCSEMLHKLLVEIVGEDAGEEIAWERVMLACFRKMDEEVNKSGAAVASTGSTAVVAVVGDEEVVVANCGDSRAVLGRGGVAVQLSDDHKPDRPDELERIESLGGKVINWNGHRVLGVLATSRSIGDQYLKPFVTTDPEVKIMSRTESDEFLILASDGLWDVISNDLACQVVRRCLEGRMRNSSSSSSLDCRSGRAAAALSELAMARGSYDNISVIVVDLRNSSLALN